MHRVFFLFFFLPLSYSCEQAASSMHEALEKKEKNKEKQFPEDFVGEYQGKMHWLQLGPEGQQMEKEVDIRLSFLELPQDSCPDARCWTWTLDYKHPDFPDITKAYRLLQDPTDKDAFFMDERNSIVLPMRRYENSIESFFRVGKQHIQTSFSAQGDTLRERILMYRAAAPKSDSSGLLEQIDLEEFRLVDVQDLRLLPLEN